MGLVFKRRDQAHRNHPLSQCENLSAFVIIVIATMHKSFATHPLCSHMGNPP
jgi:hypothetical protein